MVTVKMVTRVISACSFHFCPVYFFRHSDFVLPATKGKHPITALQELEL